MTSKLSKTIMFALAVVLVAAPLVLAQQPGSSSSGMGTGAAGPSDRPGTSPGMSGSGTTGGSTTGMQSPSMGATGAQDAIHATVDDVNHQNHTVKLRMQDGKTVELKVPEQSLTSLSKGDSVQVSIHKAEGQSNMPSSQQSRPGSDTGTTESTGTKSR
jgi:TolA-binding protein